jgi:hypothetical protein
MKKNMEDDLIFLLLQMEDDLTFLYMKDNLNIFIMMKNKLVMRMDEDLNPIQKKKVRSWLPGTE